MFLSTSSTRFGAASAAASSSQRCVSSSGLNGAEVFLDAFFYLDERERGGEVVEPAQELLPAPAVGYAPPHRGKWRVERLTRVADK